MSWEHGGKSYNMVRVITYCGQLDGVLIVKHVCVYFLYKLALVSLQATLHFDLGIFLGVS